MVSYTLLGKHGIISLPPRFIIISTNSAIFHVVTALSTRCMVLKNGNGKALRFVTRIINNIHDRPQGKILLMSVSFRIPVAAQLRWVELLVDVTDCILYFKLFFLHFDLWMCYCRLDLPVSATYTGKN